MGVIQFQQSCADFPLMVKLGEKVPSWGLSRWGGNKGLRFVPSDDEGFALRGDKRRLLYKGRRRSHRFTILGDTAFEYDCILAREPESNVISLRMEGAENFDFFRQPDFVKEPFLKGSYAVYKKETMVGEGTGKLCHIHRPEIIDARGRRCWGDLAVVGNELRITVPEKWLGEAKYPVIIDPTVGTTTIGSLYQVEYDPPDDPWTQLMFEGSIPVNRFLVPETINGNCMAYIYTYVDNYDDAGGKPVLYSDNGNKPLLRKSSGEEFVDLTISSSRIRGWRSTTFGTSEMIPAASYIWFGVFVDYFWETRFDYGTVCYCDYWDYRNNSIPGTYPINKYNNYLNLRLSMYFTYTSGQNYIRTLTQGVTLNDGLVKTADYERTVTQTAGINTLLVQCKTLFQKIQDTVKNSDTAYSMRGFFRGITDKLAILSIEKRLKIIIAKIADNIQVTSFLNRSLILFIRIVSGLFARDNSFARLLKAKTEVIIKSCVTREIVLESKIN